MPLHCLHHRVGNDAHSEKVQSCHQTGQQLDGSCYKNIFEQCELQNDFTTCLKDVDSSLPTIDNSTLGGSTTRDISVDT